MIKVKRLTKTYDAHTLNANTVLHNVTFSLPDTGFVCIVGESGCGKTSLLNTMGGLDDFDSGRIVTGNIWVDHYGTADMERERNRSFGYIFQNYYLLDEHTVGYNVYLGMHALALNHREKLRRVREALRAVDMERFIRRRVSELSGGQQQRVAIARALARRPRIIFADEPTGNLDEANTLNICSILRKVSKTSLVVMVTHEERIARFFADRIITLADGKVVDDSESWDREGLAAASSRLYTDDYRSRTFKSKGLNFRLLREMDAEPVNLTLLALKDQIILKLDDPRAITCSHSMDAPILEEGKRPIMTLEMMDAANEQESIFSDVPNAHVERAGTAGRSISLSSRIREAWHLITAKSSRRFGTIAFLVSLAILIAVALGDMLAISAVDPHDFIRTDSHMLEVSMIKGPNCPSSVGSVDELTPDLKLFINTEGHPVEYVPYVSSRLQYKLGTFRQLGEITANFSDYSLVPLDQFDADTLLYGRMPERTDEIVVDRWVLDAFLQTDGIIQNGIADISYFLGKPLAFEGKNFAPVVVGIADGGEPAVYLSEDAFLTVCVGGYEVMRLTELKLRYPGKYTDTHLMPGECIVVLNTAGDSYAGKVGQTYTVDAEHAYTIKETIFEGVSAMLILDDYDVDHFSDTMTAAHFNLYCTDKAAIKSHLTGQLPSTLDGKVRVDVQDPYTDSWVAYSNASHLRLDARLIVSVTIFALALVMLYLMQRSRVQGRIGMIAVYRLLGIPASKLVSIFTLECFLLSLISTLPVTLLFYVVVGVLRTFTDMNVGILFPWYAALITYIGTLACHMLVSLIPVLRLLRLPPAKLAAKYDI